MLRVLLLTFLSYGVTVGQNHFISLCDSNSRVSFTKLNLGTSQPLGNADVVIPQQTLANCAKLCEANSDGTGNGYPCAGFDYMADKANCMLSGPVTPTTPGLLNPSKGENSLIGTFVEELFKIVPTQTPRKSGRLIQNDEESGFYKKVCLEATAASFIPENIVYSFEQIQDRVLLGSTEQVVQAENIGQCLAACLQSKELFDFNCRSTMFYYETGDCLLNLNDRTTALKPLSKDTENFRVDYFENRVVSNECGPGTIRQYMKVTGKDMLNEHDVTIEKVSLKTCEYYCTINRAENGAIFPCRAFAYEQVGQFCNLMDEQSRPRGAGAMADADGVETYEKICLTAPSTCIKKPAFERVPGHALVGFSQVSLENVNSEEECLSKCIESYQTMAFHCMSAMYYYDAYQCILNYESRLTEGNEQFLANQTLEYNVDYFDNFCALNQKGNEEFSNTCSEKTQPTYIEFIEHELADYDTETYSQILFHDCLARCESSRNFTCNSVDYRAAEETCTLSYQNSETTPLLKTSDTNHYERRCIEKANFICGTTAVSFSASKNAYLYGSASFPISGMSLDECLALCLQDPSKSCRSINFAAKNSTCELNNATVGVNKTLYHSLDFVYYENRCLQETQAQKKSSVSDTSINNIQAFLGETAHKFTDIHPSVVTDCQYGQMRVLMSTGGQPFSGYMFSKNKFNTCGTVITNSVDSDLVLNFPSTYGPVPGGYDSQDCGVIEIARGVYSAIVIVTTNSMGIPGLVTEHDRFFNVTCDYTSALNSRVTATGSPIGINSHRNMPILYPDGELFIPSPLELSLQRNGQKIRTATLGERLELRFDFLPEFKRDLMGVFIRQCNASRTYGLPPHPSPLVMIDDGCPMPAVQRAIIPGPISPTRSGFMAPFSVFKFDGGASLQLSCAVDLCEGQCNPTSCSINGKTVQSYRKKRSLNGTDSLEVSKTKSKIKQTRTQSIIFTVVDHLPTNEKPAKEFDGKQKSREKLQNLKTKPDLSDDEYVTQYLAVRHKQICLKKATFLSVLIFLSLICIIQIVVVIIYFVRRWFIKSNTKVYKKVS